MKNVLLFLGWLTVVLCWQADAQTNPPTIIVQPQGQTMCLGQPFTVSVTVTGTPPLYYQW
jgi:hypothetical protein